MSNQLKYLGELPQSRLSGPKTASWMRRVSWPFVVVVVVPTLFSAIYFLFLATPRFVSESQFTVRAPSQASPSSLGVALQGVGIAPTTTDSYAVHRYISSREAVRDLRARFDLPRMLSGPGADLFSRYPRLGEARTEEGLFRGFKRFVTIGYDSTTGISTLRVEAFNARDAQALNRELLVGGERLVNRLNERSARDSVSDARRSQDEARARLMAISQQTTAFRNRERFIDPKVTATESASLVGTLQTTIAELKAERSQIQVEAPASPQLPALNNRIAAYERQVAAEQAKISGDTSSLASKMGAYQDLVVQQEFAEKELGQASAAVITAEQDARRQKLYLERVVTPNLPDQATEPQRLKTVITIFLTLLLIYGVGWMIVSGVREHRQG